MHMLVLHAITFACGTFFKSSMACNLSRQYHSPNHNSMVHAEHVHGSSACGPWGYTLCLNACVHDHTMGMPAQRSDCKIPEVTVHALQTVQA